MLAAIGKYYIAKIHIRIVRVINLMGLAWGHNNPGRVWGWGVCGFVGAEHSIHSIQAP